MSYTSEVAGAGLNDNAIYSRRPAIGYIRDASADYVREPGSGFADILSETLSTDEAEASAAANHPEQSGTPAGGETPVGGGMPASSVNYPSMIADALSEELTRMSLAAVSGSSEIPGIQMPMQNQALEQMIMSSASSGQVTDTQLALFMLMMMMQTSGGGDSSMLMQMMATMLTQLQGESDKQRNGANVDQWGRPVIGARIPGLSGTSQAILPDDAWRPSTPSIISTVNNRSPQLYRAVVDQFNVESAERYRPKDGKTYCNIFVWDVTSAMGAEIPHYTDPVTGEPRHPPNTRGAISMGAVRICAWLETHGRTYGWREVDAETAQRYANEGRPAVTSVGSLRHVQMVVPSRDGRYDPVRGVAVAQAGGRLTNYTYITTIYRPDVLRNNVRYWVHA